MCLNSKGRSEDGEFTVKGLVRTTGQNNAQSPSKVISSFRSNKTNAMVENASTKFYLYYFSK
jgi:uncharacterized protein YcbK (DUF882 family)